MLASMSGTVIKRQGGHSIIDSRGNFWSIDPLGRVQMNGRPDKTTQDVSELAYVSNVIWRGNGNGVWWSNPTAKLGAWLPS